MSRLPVPLSEARGPSTLLSRSLNSKDHNMVAKPYFYNMRYLDPQGYDPTMRKGGGQETQVSVKGGPIVEFLCCLFMGNHLFLNR